MLDLKFLRENPDLVKENIKKKFQDEKLKMVDEVIELDAESRKVQTEADELRANRNSVSKKIGALMGQGKKEEAQKLAEKMNKISLRIQVKAGENGKIFGGVSAKDISEAFEKQHNIKIDKKKIDLKETIKTLGIHTVSIKLFEGVIGKIKVDVIG